MADVEVRAAHNVIEACAQTDTIEKVVFTSSVAAVIWRDDRKSTPSDLDERHWTDINFARKFKVKNNINNLVFTYEIVSFSHLIYLFIFLKLNIILIINLSFYFEYLNLF